MTVQEKTALGFGLLLLALLAAVILGPHDWIVWLADWIHQPRNYQR